MAVEFSITTGANVEINIQQGANIEFTVNPIAHGLPAGGTTGQVLKKTSGTDYDVEWSSTGGGGGGATVFTDLSDVPNSYSGQGSKYVKVNEVASALEFEPIEEADLPTGIDAAKIADGTVSNTEFQTLNGVTSAIQTQLNGKAATVHTHAIGDVTGLQTALDGKQPISTVLTNTTASFTTADKTKLDGIEAGADITDAGNVGSTVAGVTEKTTPVDADTLPLTDSAASNVLKKVSWANIKVTLKTYFDTLYHKIDKVNTASVTAVNGTQYIQVASSTYTDPTPSEGEGYSVLVRNGTATIGGTGYSTAGRLIYRIFHSGAWATYDIGIQDLSGYLTASSSATLTNKSIDLANNTVTGTKAQFDTACSDGNFAYQSDLASYQPLDSDLTTIAAISKTNDNFLQVKSGGWVERTPIQAAADLQGTGLTDASVGFRNIPVNSQSASYTTVAADNGKLILHPSTDANSRTFTIDSNANVAYPVGTAITFVNMTSQVVTIAITSDTMYLAGTGTTGSRSLAQYGMATAVKLTSTTWIINGSGLT